jgi:hypothetical protein
MTNYQHDDEQAKQQNEELHLHDELTAESAAQDQPSEPRQGARLALEETAKDLPLSDAEERARIGLEDTARDAPVELESLVRPEQPDKAPEPALKEEIKPEIKEESVELERDLYRGTTRPAEKPLDEKIRRLEDRPAPARSTPRTQRRDDRYRRQGRAPEQWGSEQTKAIGYVVLAVIGVIVLGREVGVIFEMLRNWWALLILVPGIWALDKGYTPYRLTGRLPQVARQWLVGGFIGTLVGLVGLFNLGYLMPLWIILSGLMIWWVNKNR